MQKHLRERFRFFAAGIVVAAIGLYCVDVIAQRVRLNGVTVFGNGITIGTNGITLFNGTVVKDSALGVVEMVSSGATNGFRTPNGTSAEYGGCLWLSNFLNCGTVTNGGVARPVRIISGSSQVVSVAPGGTDAWIFTPTGTTTTAGLTTVGRGVSAVVAQARTVAATNTGTASVATFTVGAADATFQVGCNVLVTTSTTHSFSCDVTYTDESNSARVLVLPMAQLAGSFVATGLITNVTGVGPYESPMMAIRAKAATAITVRTSSGGTFTTVVYNIDGTILQVS